MIIELPSLREKGKHDVNNLIDSELLAPAFVESNCIKCNGDDRLSKFFLNTG